MDNKNDSIWNAGYNLRVRVLGIVVCCLLATQSFGQEKPNGKTENALLNILASFPGEQLDALGEELIPEEFSVLVQDGESQSWIITQVDKTNNAITVRNKMADIQIRFYFYFKSSNAVVAGVQQITGQNTVTRFWQSNRLQEDMSKVQWASYPMPTMAISEFLAENVILPRGYEKMKTAPYIDVSFSKNKINYSINKWIFFKNIQSGFGNMGTPFNDDDALSYVKYQFEFYWTSDKFVQRRQVIQEYSAVLMSTALVPEDSPHGGSPTEHDCPQGVSVEASSELAPQGQSNYSAANVLDEKNETAWSTVGAGIGQWIEFTLKTDNDLIGNVYQIRNGYLKSEALWKANNRVKKLKVLINDKVVTHVVLVDIDAYQAFIIYPDWMKDQIEHKPGTKIRFVIEEIYKGEKYNDTLISHFVPQGQGGCR